MPRASRSRSRGRPAKNPQSPTSVAKKSPAAAKKKAAATPKSASKKAAPVAAAANMAFDEGDAVMARWPGTQLFFKVMQLNS